MNGVIYARYSCDKQTENSILGQVRECNDFARKEGINVINVYKDEAISGRTDRRPGFIKMIQDARNHFFDCIIVWKGDRFSRSRADAAKYKTELKKLGIRVLSATEANVTGPEAILMDGINEAFAEYYSVELAAKVKRGLVQNTINGKFNGGVMPLGYKKDGNKIVLDEEKAPIIRELYDLYLGSAQTIAQIHKLFVSKGYTDNKGKPMARSSFYRILQNPRYYGHYEFDGVSNDSIFPAIVTKEEWEAAKQKAFGTHKKAQQYRARVLYILSGKLICGNCLTLMQGISSYSHTGEIHNYYYCPNKKRGLCEMDSFRKQELEDAVIMAIANFLKKDETIEFYVKAITKYAKENKSSQYIDQEKNLRETNKKIANLTQAIENGGNMKILVDRLNQLQKIKETIEQDLTKRKIEGEFFSEDNIRKFFKNLAIKDYSTEEERKYLIDTLVESIYIFNNKNIRILYKYTNQVSETTYEARQKVRLQSQSAHHVKKSSLP